ncbi:restriction endonuclease subunit S [Ligilactobacillus salivarius]|uniref:restriction endonuclease subunit S n=3 Tax=Ligilactobacillus salivarius TaxID=1624 RepID=UPI003CFFA64D
MAKSFFYDIWERKEFGDVVEFYSGLTYKPENIAQSGTLVIRSSNIHNSQYVNADNVYVKNNIVNSEYVKKQDIVVVVRNGSRNLIGKHALLTSIPHNPSVIGAFMTGIRSSDNQFIETLLNTEQFKREINKNLGATINQITTSQFKKMRFHFSKQKENKQIGVLFTYLDNSINLHERKCEELALIKKALLQKLFPKKDEIKPEVRYKNFSDAWEQRKFSEILAKSDGLRRGPFGSALKKEFFISSSEYTVYEQNNAIYNTWKTRYFITPEKFQELHKFQLVPGDFILSGAGTIGRIAQVPANITKGVFNQALIRIRINPEWMDKNFFLIWMQSENMQRKLTQANPGSAMTNLVPMSEIKKWEIIIPSKAEQNKIGEFIQKLNSLITLHQRKLERLKQLKKFLLQNMFI